MKHFKIFSTLIILVLILTSCTYTKEVPNTTVKENSAVITTAATTTATAVTTTASTTTITKTTTIVKTTAISVTPIEKTMYVTAALNVRKGPSTDYEKLGQFSIGDSVNVTGITGNWYRVEYDGNVGFCFGDYLTEIKPAIATVNQNPYLIKVNRLQNIVTVYSKDESDKYTLPYKAMTCSVGKNNGTPTGTFTTTDKYTWRLLVGGVYGQYATRITGSILFHSVPYFSQDKSDLEYEEYNKLGEAASLGCVRLSVIDAKWIYDNCPSGTTVIIYDSANTEPITPNEPIKIDTQSPNRGWDPTDPDKNNPW